VVDVHAHALLPDRFGDLGPHERYRPSFARVGRSERIVVDGKALPPDIDRRLYDVDARLRDLEAWGGGAEVLQLISPPPFTFLYDLPPKAGVALARAQNDSIASLAEERPERFAALGTLPLQHPSGALEELDRVVKELGMKGVELGTNVEGRDLDLPEFRPLLRRIQDLEVPVLLHPHARPTYWPVLNDYYLGNPLGYPMETTIAMARLILSGVCQEFPRLRFLTVHGGGFIPYQWGRILQAHIKREETRTEVAGDLDKFLGRFLFDSLVHSREALGYLVEWAGIDKVLLGSDYPFPMGDEEAIAKVRALGLDEGDEARILGRNAGRLFRLQP
jgi:aminocarboxymuconate-semialdehyde decarboxylase